MRHNKWFVLAAFVCLSLWMNGCSCGGHGPTVRSLGEGKLVEHGSSGEKNLVDGTTVDFGPVLVGSRVEHKVTVVNDGTGILQVPAVAPSVPFASCFNYDVAPTFTLDVGEEKTFSVFFEPKDADEGDQTGTLTFTLANDTSTSHALVVTIKGKGVKAGCTVTPADTLDFGSVALGTSYVKQVKISNASELEYQVNVAGIISESDPNTFLLNNFPAGYITVPSHSEVLVPIEFRPNHVGAHQAALSIPDPAVCQIVLPIVGNGIEDVLDCEPKVKVKDPNTGRDVWQVLVDFGFVNPNTKATSQVTCKNLGNDDIILSGLNLEQDPRGAVFNIEMDDPTVQLTVPHGGAATIPLSFLPALLGPYSGKLKFSTSDAKLPLATVGLAGVGGGPSIDVQPPRLDFGPVAVNTYQRRRVTIANVGTDVPNTTDDNLKLMATDGAESCSKDAPCKDATSLCLRGTCWKDKDAVIEVTSGDPSEFSVERPEGYNNPPGIVAGQSNDMKVKFAPKTAGAKSAKVTIYSTDPTRPALVIEVVGLGADMPPCNYDVVPPQVNFGNVEPNKNLALSFFIRNNAQNPADECLISTLGFSHGTSSSFTLVQGPISGAHVKGGESLEVPVRFGPKQNGTYSGSVEFYISSVNAPEGQVSLSGSSQSGCLLIAPNALDFGVIEINCNSRDRSFTLYNVCSTNQVIQTIDLQQGLSTEFHIVQKPTLPYTLSAGNSVDFKVKYAPVDSGTDQGSIAITTTKFTQPYVIPISGRGDVNAIQTDVFAQDPQPKVDVLFVVDDSGSMSAHQVSLGQNFASFIQYAEKQAVDYHIAVTTTSVDIAHGGQDDNGGTDPDENGCFVPITGSNPKVVTPLTPNLAQVFAQNVNVGTNGNYTELLIRPTYLALTNPNLSGCNNVGFLRDEANLAVVVVSDAADQDNAGAAGPMPVPFYINAFFNIKGLKRQNMFSFSSIDPKHEDTATCSQDGSQTFDPQGNIENTRVQQVVTASGGVTDDICTQDWAKTLQKLGQTAFGYRTRFFLSNVPDVSAGNVITVQIIPPNETTPVDYPPIGPFGDTRWTYNSNADAIDFELLAVPEPGSTIIVSYHVACLH